MTELLFSPKHWTPREKVSLAELERLREIYPPEAFRESWPLARLGEINNLRADGRIFLGQLRMLIGLPGARQERIQEFWVVDDGSIIIWGSTLAEVQSAWRERGSGRPWGQGIRIRMME